MKAYAEYQLWLKSIVDEEIVKELKDMAEDPEHIIDAFYKNLAFGTGGLRGIIGAGTNRMNIYTVRKASQGIANYIKKNYPEQKEKSLSATITESNLMYLQEQQKKYMQQMEFR